MSSPVSGPVMHPADFSRVVQARAVGLVGYQGKHFVSARLAEKPSTHQHSNWWTSRRGRSLVPVLKPARQRAIQENVDRGYAGPYDQERG